MKKVLISGSSGFTGRHLCQFLSNLKEVDIVGLDLNTSDLIRTHQANMLNLQETAAVLAEEKPDYIIHLAGINRSSDYRHFYQYNLFSAVNILEAVKTHNLTNTRMLFISSSAVYGKVTINPVRESAIPAPVNFYGNSKLAMEAAVLHYFYNFALKVHIVRPFNLIGPGQDTSFVVPYFAEKITSFKKSEGPAAMTTKSLSSARDFVDVRDAVSAYWRVISEGKPGEIYNVASGKAIVIRDLLDMIIELAGADKEIKIEEGRPQPGEIPIITGDTKKIARLNWTAETGIRQTLGDIIATLKT